MTRQKKPRVRPSAFQARAVRVGVNDVIPQSKVRHDRRQSLGSDGRDTKMQEYCYGFETQIHIVRIRVNSSNFVV